MLFGLYAPVPHVTVGSKEIARSVKGALSPLPSGEIDPAFRLARDVLREADARGFDLVLYAERHLGADFEAWILAAAVSSWTRKIRAMPAVHPSLWHPTLIAKMASSLDSDWWFLDYDKSAGDTDAVMESLRRSITDMDCRAERHGRKVRYAFNPFIGFGTSDEAAIEHTKRLLTPEEPDADIRKMMSRIGPAMKSGCIGRPEKVREQLMRYHDMGIELFLLKFVPTVEEVRMIADEIIEPLQNRPSLSTRPARAATF